MTRKQLLVEIYDHLTGALLKTWTNAQLMRFTKEINRGLSECVIVLGETYDYTGSELAEGNDVVVKIYDGDCAPSTLLTIYTGYISSFETNLAERDAGVTVHVLGYHTLLAMDVFKDGTTTTIAYSAEDVGAVMQDIIDKFNAAYGYEVFSYTAASIPTAGADIDYTFQRKTYREAMDRTRELAPATHYFYIDETNLVTFRPMPTTPTHTFTLGRHFSALAVSKSIEKIRNGLLIWDGENAGLHKLYTDSASQARYGRRTQIETDYGIVVGDADLYAARFLLENKEPETNLTVEIMDNNANEDGSGYDIESIQPGDTCSFVGFAEAFASKYLSANMLITKVVYSMGKVTLTIDPRLHGFFDTQDALRKQLAETQSSGVPTAYTT